jgi:hypothetical protein
MQKGILVVSLILAAPCIPQKSSGGCAEGSTGEWEEGRMALVVSRREKRGCSLIAFALATALAAPSLAQAQDNSTAPPPPAATQAASMAPAVGGEQTPPAQSLFTRAELEKLLAPISLYPDALLAQLLAASAYPVQIVQAQRWLDKNKAAVANNNFSWIDSQDWDPAVKALARFPDLITKMSDDLEWTTDLGDAEVNQPQDVADVIQELRAEAETAGALTTTPQQAVSSIFVNDRPYITIEPAEPSIVYVPSYEPVVVYQPALAVSPLLTFGAGVAVGALWKSHCWDWRTGAIYPPVWAGYPGWRPPYPGWRPGQPVRLAGRLVGGNINIAANPKPWRPGPDYRPRLGPGVGANRPGGGSTVTRPPVGRNIISTGDGNTITPAGAGNNIVSTRPGTGNFVSARPETGNFVSTRLGTATSSAHGLRPATSSAPDLRPATSSTLGRVESLFSAACVAVAPRVAPILPNFSPPGAPAMGGIRPGVGAIGSASRGVISRSPARGGLIAGAIVRPGAFGGGLR